MHQKSKRRSILSNNSNYHHHRPVQGRKDAETRMRIVVGFLLVQAVAAVAGNQYDPGTYHSHHHHYYGTVSNAYGRPPSRHDDVTRHDDDQRDHGAPQYERYDVDDRGERVWRFHIGDSYGAYEYLDRDGYLRGFNIDLLTLVCGQAGKHCAYTMDMAEHCWNTKAGLEYPGVGLMDHWYDGCMGFQPNADRLNAFNFTHSYTINTKAALHYSQADVDSPADVEGKKIGFVEGWVESKRCLHRQRDMTGNRPDEFYPRFYGTHSEMIEAVRKGEVDAIVDVDVFEPESYGVVPQGPWIQCSLSGSAVMTRYGSPVIQWWNAAFEHLRSTGEYRRLCEQAAIKHGAKGKVHCLEY